LVLLGWRKFKFLGVRSLLTGKITSVTPKRRAPEG